MGAGRRMVATAVVIAVVLAGCTGGGDDAAAFCELLDQDFWARLNGGESVDVIVFMSADATEDEVADMREEIEADDQVVSSTFSDQDAAYEEFTELFANTPEMVGAVSPVVMPPRIWVDLGDADEVAMGAWQEAHQDAAGVYRVVTQAESGVGRTVLDGVIAPIGAAVGGVAVIATTPADLWDELLEAAPDEIGPAVESVRQEVEAAGGLSVVEVDAETVEAATDIVDVHEENCE